MPARFPSWEEVIARYGLQLTHHGGQYRGPCPLHGGANPTSFAISPGRGFYCHACGRGGGVAAFLELMGDPAAPGVPPRPWVDGRSHTVPSPRDLERLARERERLLAALPPVPAIRPLDPCHPYLRSRGVSPKTARRFGCGYHWGQGAFGGRVVFPVRTPDGRLVGHVGRAVDADLEPRYRFQKGLRKGLLLLNEHAVASATGTDTNIVNSDNVAIIPAAHPATSNSRRTNEICAAETSVNPGQVAGAGTEDTISVVVVEGPFDALAVCQAGFSAVVALLGCQATGHQLAALARYPRVVVALDGDGPGREGAARVAAALGGRAAVVRLGGDPASSDPAALASVLSAAGAVRTVP